MLRCQETRNQERQETGMGIIFETFSGSVGIGRFSKMIKGCKACGFPVGSEVYKMLEESIINGSE
jgi:hypothetical protein